MALNKTDKLIVGSTAVISVGSFFLSSISTQDSALGGQSIFDPETQRPLIAFGWAATGITGVAAGVWAKSNAMAVLGAAIVVGGLVWTYWVPHPLVNGGKATKSISAGSDLVRPAPVLG